MRKWRRCGTGIRIGDLLVSRKAVTTSINGELCE